MALFLQPPISHVLGMIGAFCMIVSFIGPELLGRVGSWVPALGAFLVIAAGPKQWINRRVLAVRPMVFIGLISYPLYLWHMSLFEVATILHGDVSSRMLPLIWKVVVIAASFVLSYVTYRYIELPLRSSRSTKCIALLLCIAMGVCGTAAYFTLG